MHFAESTISENGRRGRITMATLITWVQMSRVAAGNDLFPTKQKAAIFVKKNVISPLIRSEAFVEPNPVKPLHLAHWDNWPWAVCCCAGAINHLLFFCIVSARGIVLVRWKTCHIYETSIVFQIGPCVGSSTAPFKALVKVDGKQAVRDGV